MSKHCLIISLFISFYSVLAGQTFYVSPSGSDAFTGEHPDLNASKNDGPFRTLHKANQAVARVLQEQDQPITVYLRGGMHFLAEPLCLGLDHAGTEHTVTWQNYANETPMISSGLHIKNWRKLNSKPPGLPDSALGHVYVADLPDSIGLFHSLYDGIYRLKRARSQGFTPTQSADDPNRSNTELHYPPAAPLKNWDNIKDVEIYIRPWCLWAMNILPLARVDEQNRIAHTARPGTYPLTRERYERFGPESVWVENILEALTEPGQWVVNTRERKIYLWPVRSIEESEIYIPRLRHLVTVEGDEPGRTPVRNVIFRGISFVHADRDTWQPGDRGLQHDWDKYDKPNSLLRFRWARNCRIENCGFLDAASGGLRLDLYAQDITVENCEFARLGGTGILLAGYVPGKGHHNRNNRILNNRIHHVGQLHWQSPGIMLWQSGENLISHNLIHHTPYNGIAFSGVSLRVFNDTLENKPSINELAWAVKKENLPRLFAEAKTLDWPAWKPYLYTRGNRFEYNRVHHVIETLGDGNAVYVRMAGDGNVIRRNFFHDIYGSHDTITSMLRADDAQDKTEFSENIIYRAVCGAIALKAGNLVKNNFMVDILTEDDPGNIHKVKLLGYMLARPSSYSYDGSGYDWHDKSVITGNIFYSTGPSPPLFYFELNEKWPREYYEKMKAILLAPSIDRNLFYWTGDTQNRYVSAYLEKIRTQRDDDKHSLIADPLFVDPAGHDFRFRPDSPARDLRIVALDAREMGLADELDERFEKYCRIYEKIYAPWCFTGIKMDKMVEKKQIQKGFGHE